MLPLIIAGALAVGAIIAAVSSDDESKFTESENSNCNPEFLKFNSSLSITPTKEQQLEGVRKVLQPKIKDYFMSKTSANLLGFYIQGSYKHETIIRKQDDTCDIDLGIYFNNKPSVTPVTLKGNIAELFEDHTKEKAKIKNKCVRIYYANQFHVDFPIYYKDSKTNQYYIAVSNSNTWELSDPKLFTEWIKDQTNGNDQKIRLIKYFKAWADVYKKRNNHVMPSGLAFTIWVMTFYKEESRDDLAFVKTANQLYNYLKKKNLSDWKCEMPVLPNDNIIDKLKEEQKNNFLKALEELITSSEKILAMKSKTECIKSWKYFFGKWFPENQIETV